MDLEDLK